MTSSIPDDISPPMPTSKKSTQYLAAVSSTLAAVTAANYIGWSSPALPLYNQKDTLALSDDEKSWVGSLLALGALLGAIPAGWVADKFGRKKSILMIGVPCLLFWFMIGFAPSTLWLFVARFLSGVANGATTVIVPMYVSEIAEPATRGTIGSLFELQMAIGLSLGWLTGLIGNLKWIAMTSATIPAALLLSFIFMPETPVWLIGQNRRKDAERAMERLRGRDFPFQQELAQLEFNKESQSKQRAGFSELKNHKRAVLISFGLTALQQLSGINAVVFYAEELFVAKESVLTPTVCAAIMGVAQVLATVVSTVLADKAGRRILLMISTVVMGVCLIVVAVHFHFQAGVQTKGIPWVPLIFFTIYISMYAIGCGPVPWIMVNEVSPTNVVGTISASAAMINWSLTFVVTKVFINLQFTIGLPLTFGMFALLCMIGTIFVAVVVPETKGKTKEEIQLQLHKIKKAPMDIAPMEIYTITTEQTRL
ncbi:facilitated trehalose transporter Tret1-like [Neodiprion fabricii]|uniref:facilitated trehalose transporter Tret1-like n=1 Tax=Neodiprion fabricii TaxID=2872261 RepID=UPI001ED97487|nr:facilitated trehalose transporter Tret1-like [Neodiprion fabricii]XP_046409483.1 facilitated trehalose transporter Tret1-like [Neodiprion fabricii]XP_046409484.1 facilitated trehalose transporter Tret1-like [Neodiprion fabricii]